MTTDTHPAAFQEFPKLARLSRECIITEKIDGTNAQVFIYDPIENTQAQEGFTSAADASGKVWNIKAGSRTRWVTPASDNHGFAKWVWDNAEKLVHLGPGRHFGEWWGQGIQRNYGMREKRWSLFNVARWCLHGKEPQRILTADPRIVKMQEVLPECCHLVPVLHRGIFTTDLCELGLEGLRIFGSFAAPGFMKPEGIVCFHVAGNFGFKKTLDNDALPKGAIPQK
jgi:hypothetical protein